MVPYLLLMFVPLLFAFVAYAPERGEWVIAPQEIDTVKQRNCLIPVFFGLLIVLLSLRDETIGKDLMSYQYYFEKFASADLQSVLQRPSDVLFYLLIWLMGRFTNSYQVFLTVIAMITVVPIAIIYSRDRQNGFLKIVLFMSMTNFVLLFSALRQCIAIGLGLLAYEFVKKKKPVPFLLLSLLALGFHHSAFVILTFYPLYHFRFEKKYLWVAVPGILAVFLFNKQIFVLAVSIVNKILGTQYSADVSATGAYTTLLLFAVFSIFSFVFPDEETLDRETLGLRNFLLMAVLMQCFAPVHALAMRMNYYYIVFIPVLIPKLLQHPKPDIENIARYAKAALLVFFVGYYLLTTYISCKTGASALNTYPYVPFWAG